MTRTSLCSITIILGLGACSSSAATSEQRESPSVQLLAEAPKIEATRLGTDAPILWRAPMQTSGICTHSFAKLETSEVRADARRLYVDLRHHTDTTPEKYESSAVAVELLVDGCPALVEPQAQGKVWKDWPSPSSVELDLASLPDGELELTLKAFGMRATLPMIAKVGNKLKHIGLRQSKQYKEFPAEPKFNIPPTLSYVPPTCSPDGSDEVVQ